MAAFVPPLLFPVERRLLFGDPLNWGPGAISIAVASIVALAVRRAHLRPAVVMFLGLVFEVVSCYGIAEFIAPTGRNCCVVSM